MATRFSALAGVAGTVCVHIMVIYFRALVIYFRADQPNSYLFTCHQFVTKLALSVLRMRRMRSVTGVPKELSNQQLAGLAGLACDLLKTLIARRPRVRVLPPLVPNLGRIKELAPVLRFSLRGL
jgi:hypothetical protein